METAFLFFNVGSSWVRLIFQQLKIYLILLTCKKVVMCISSFQSKQCTALVDEGLRSRQLIAGAVAHGPWPTDNESCHGKAVKTSQNCRKLRRTSATCLSVSLSWVSYYTRLFYDKLGPSLRGKDCISAALKTLKLVSVSVRLLFGHKCFKQGKGV